MVSTKLPQIEVGDYTRELLHTMLATLIVPDDSPDEQQRSRVGEMVFKVTEATLGDFIPEQCVFERAVMRALIACESTRQDDNAIIPTQTMIEGLLKADGHRDAKASLDAIMQKRPTAPNARVESFQYEHAIKRERIQWAAQKNLALAMNPKGKGLHEIVREMVNNLAMVDPMSYKTIEYDMFGLAQAFADKQGRITEMYERTGAGVPIFPFKNIQAMLGGLEAGNPLLITAATGTGKSMFLIHLAMYWAEFFRYRVVVLTHETTFDSIQKRIYARELGLPSIAFKNAYTVNGYYMRHANIPKIAIDSKAVQVVDMGDNRKEFIFAPIDPRNAFWKPLFDEIYVQQIVSTHKGKFVLVPMRDASPETIVSEVRAQAEKAARDGMPLIILNDYIQKWNVRGIKADREDLRYGVAADSFKDVAMDAEAYAVVASQTTVNANTGEPKAKHSAEINEKFQMHIHMDSPKMEESDVDEAVTMMHTLINGEVENRQLTNFFGMPRWYNSSKYKGIVNVTSYKSNDTDVGASERVIVERPVLLMYDFNQSPKIFYNDIAALCEYHNAK